jgi:hypothetical protein
VAVPLALLVGSVLVAMLAFQPPAPQPASAPAEAFSAERALVHVWSMARQPHPVGSAEHARVRDYLLSELKRLGLSPEVQRTAVVAEYPTPFGLTYRPAATVQNVLARLPGRSSERALLLMAHYDSVPAGPGANDNAAAVATLLETARALISSGQVLAHDIFFLFTDAEEVGLLGAKAFFEQHPQRHRVAAVLNFEARGSHGPVLMFETGPDSGWLVDELASGVPTPLASSLFDEAYRYLPNMTEFTLAKAAGLPGLNFAYIDGLTDYHSALDRPENVDPRSVQHQGEYALHLARRLADGGPSREGSTRQVFFNVAGLGLVAYPERWSLPLAVGAALLWAGVVAHGLRRKRLAAGPLARGLGAFPLLLATVIAAAVAISLLAGATHAESRRAGDAYGSGVYLAGLLAVTVAASALLVVRLRRRTEVPALAAGACAWWVLLAVLTAAFLPGISFLFSWPLVSAMLGLALLPDTSGPPTPSWRWLAALALSAVPPLLIVAPLVHLTFVGLTLRLAAVTALLAALLCGLLIPLLHALTAKRAWPVAATALAAGLGLITFASVPSAPTEWRPRANNIFYALDADTGHALWCSSDEQVDDWTQQFFLRDVREGQLPDFIPRWGQDFRYAPAPVLAAPPPLLELLADTVSGDRRALRLRLASPRGARSAAVSIYGLPVLTYAVDGAPGPNRPEPESPAGAAPEWTLWVETLLPDGNTLDVTVPAGSSFTVRVMDRSDGLPALPGFSPTPRPPHMIPAPALDVENWGNATYVSHALPISSYPSLSTAR